MTVRERLPATASATSPTAFEAIMATPRRSTGRTSRKAREPGSKPPKEPLMRALIADDEAPARARLRQLLAAHPDVEIVAEAETGSQAMEFAAEHKPDLLLL